MTETEWRTSTDPDAMLDFLLGKSRGGVLTWLGLRRPRETGQLRTSERKLRLYACACCRRIWDFMPDRRSREAVEVSEQYADGLANKEELLTAFQAALEVIRSLPPEPQLPLAMTLAPGADFQEAPRLAAYAASALAAPPAIDALVPVAVTWVMRTAMAMAANGEENWAATAVGAASRVRLLRDIFGNPFRTIAIEPAWLAWQDGTVPKIAQAVYDAYHFEELPILADALEEAGCENSEILAHCREQTEHVRGCWVVDRLLGRD
jgi:hypothetical protein